MTSVDEKPSGEGQRKTPLGIEKRFDRFGDWLDTSWVLKKATPMLDRHPRAVTAITWLMRICVGATFVVSGLAKAIDPWGTYYKMQDYLTAMHLPLSEWGNTVLALSFFLFSIEFIIGVSMLTGCFRKATPILASLFMLVMLPLTLWIAIADPVADCGCFGDLIQISNWATFFKNVLLSLAAVWLLKFNRKARCLITPYLQWMAALGAGAYIVATGLIGYRQQPMLDFRPYKTGTLLFATDDEPEYIPVYDFIYAKDGEERRFGEDDELPDEAEGWKFVRREEKEFVKNSNSRADAMEEAPDFRVWNEDATEDVTESLGGVDEQLILLSPDINGVSMADSWKINRLHDIAEANDVEFFAVASGKPEDIRKWQDLSSGQYPIYTAEDTSIKELVRGNPALVSLREGRIVWKTALSAIVMTDDYDEEGEVKEEKGSVIATYPIGMTMSGSQAFECMSIILVAFLGMIALISHMSVSTFLTGGVDAKEDKEQDGEAPES